MEEFDRDEFDRKVYEFFYEFFHKQRTITNWQIGLIILSIMIIGIVWIVI